MERHLITQLHRRQSSSLLYPPIFQLRNQINGFFLQNLRLEYVLEGHTGCVNCLDWNADGSRLASGSDDTNVIIWDPFKHKKVHLYNTQHNGNIFSIKFMPCTGDQVVVTGAADGYIYIHDIIGKDVVFSSHMNGRVKKLVTTITEPNTIISAAEDGFIREFDTRERSGGRVLVDLTVHCGPSAECKCVAMNPVDSNSIAVGANDPYVRLYDRRMVKADDESCSYFAPGHIQYKQNEYRRQLRNLCVTHVTFNPRGNELLVNIGGEQIYLFDIHNKVEPMSLEPLQHSCNGVKKRHKMRNSKEEEAISDSEEHMPKRSRSSPDETDELECTSSLPGKSNGICEEGEKSSLENLSEHFRLLGNEFFGKQQFTSAVTMYNKAIGLNPSMILYSNRAAAYIKRAWDGDLYAALRDCYSALRFSSSHIKSHFRLARCMFELKWFDKAMTCIREFKSLHPEHAGSTACLSLEKDIRKALKQNMDQTRKGKKDKDNLSRSEILNRTSSYDYKFRYCGHCNTTTDIKEANYFGSEGQYIVAGSDEGSLFIWETETTNLVRVMQADSSIVNCLQPHPTCCMLATSGIDPVVKLWSPISSGVDQKDQYLIKEMDSVAAANQKRMNTDPLESMLISMGMRIVPGSNESASEGMPCRTT